jgi:hypothetical protein
MARGRCQCADPRPQFRRRQSDHGAARAVRGIRRVTQLRMRSRHPVTGGSAESTQLIEYLTVWFAANRPENTVRDLLADRTSTVLQASVVQTAGNCRGACRFRDGPDTRLPSGVWALRRPGSGQYGGAAAAPATLSAGCNNERPPHPLSPAATREPSSPGYYDSRGRVYSAGRSMADQRFGRRIVECFATSLTE